MLILGIETSCDETALALYCTERGLLAEQLHSQVALHADYGGVIPELAARDHQTILPILFDRLLKHAEIDAQQIEGIGCTVGPGLIGALRVGTAFAGGLALGLGVPLLGVHHMEAHLLAPQLETGEELPYPHLALLVSGGHSMLVRVLGFGDYELVGATRDDAAGEAFDKAARLLGLGYPGGPAIEKAATEADTFQSPADKHPALPRPMLHDGLDFSFAGLKTSLHYRLRDLGLVDMRGLSVPKKSVTKAMQAVLAADFQAAVTEVFAVKCERALKEYGYQYLVAGGGVLANKTLRSALQQSCDRCGAELRVPAIRFCTDNGAMIAYTAARRFEAGAEGVQDLDAFPRYPLHEVQPP